MESIDIQRNWSFDRADVAGQFDRHVREQLPWYELATGAIAHIARHYVPAGGVIYDIGASTGNIDRALAETTKDRGATFIPIEYSCVMASKYDGPSAKNLKIADATKIQYEEFDVAILFLVLMFIPTAERAAFIRTLRSRLRPGGAIIVFDKLPASTGYPATVMWRLTLAGKLAAGVPAKDIIEKELSLVGVQRPLDPAVLGPGALEWFRFGEFAGWLIEKTETDGRRAAPRRRPKVALIKSGRIV